MELWIPNINDTNDMSFYDDFKYTVVYKDGYIKNFLGEFIKIIDNDLPLGVL